MSGELEHQLAERIRVVQSLLLVHKVCAALSLTERASTCDTLVNLASSQLGVQRGVIVLEPRQGEDCAYPTYDTPREGLDGVAASALFAQLLSERGTRMVATEEVAAAWPDAPPWCVDGFAFACIDVADRPIGGFLVAELSSGQAFAAADLELLTGCAGITALALANADLHAARERSLQDAKQQTDAARRLAEERERAMALIGAQRAEIRTLSAPILQVTDDTVALPIVGAVDAERSAAMTEKLLLAITARQVENVIVDLTGIEAIDAQTARLLLDMIKAASLLGARCLLSGARPSVAIAIAELGLDLDGITLRRTLREAVAACSGG